MERHASTHGKTPVRRSGVRLVASGVQQVLLPQDLLADEHWQHTLVERLALNVAAPHLILPNSWILLPNDRAIFPIATVAIYPADDVDADAFHQALERARHTRLLGTPLIRVAHSDVYLKSESGSFRDRVEGIELPVDRLLDQLRTARQVELF